MQRDTTLATPLSGVSFNFLRIFREGSEYVRPKFYIFSNGRQACKIRVEFLAVENGMPRELTPAEIFNSFKLISYSGGNLLGSGKYTAWKVWKIPSPYVWNENLVMTFAAPMAAGEADERRVKDVGVRATGTQVFDFWVMTEVAESLRVAVAFIDENGSVIASTNWDLPGIEEGSDRGDGFGKFNSSVNIIGTKFNQPDIAYYGRKWSDDRHRLLDTRVKGSNNSLRSYEQLITLTYEKTVFHWVSMSDGGLAKFSLWNDEGKAPSGAEWCITYVYQPRSKIVGYSDSLGCLLAGASHAFRWSIPELMDEYAVSNTHDTSALVIGMVLSDEHLQIYDRNVARLPSRRSADLLLRDEFGNDHKIRLFLIGGNGFNYLAIDSHSSVAAISSDVFSVDSLGIQLQQTRLYANGRQQVRVGITVEARLGGVDTSLTEEEWASLRFLDHDSREPVPFTDTAWTGGDVGWAAQHHDAGYARYPGSFTASESIASDTRYFFISVDAAAHGIPLRLAFSIQGRNGTIYASTGHVTPPGEAARPDPSYDVRLGIDITQEIPLRYSGSEIDIGWYELPHTAEDIDEAVYNRAGVMTIQPRTGFGPSIKRLSCNPAGVVHWQTLMPGDTNPCALAYAQPDSRDIHCDAGVAALMSVPKQLDRPQLYSSVLVLCGRVGVPMAGNEKLPRDRMAVTLLDGYGTEHNLTLQFKAGTREDFEFV
ncbi:hypothetical protein KPL74_07490 [Bacillus sp. NP157]|nr:hypothetical protein KPL74_07490 [Bacillus sp. NP157]